MNLLSFLKQRIKIDYDEMMNHLVVRYNFSRDRRAIERAVSIAKEKNKLDGKSYYIMKDITGRISPLNNHELDFWQRRGLFTKTANKNKLEDAIAIVTSNEVTYKQYAQIMNKKA